MGGRNTNRITPEIFLEKTFYKSWEKGGLQYHRLKTKQIYITVKCLSMTVLGI